MKKFLAIVAFTLMLSVPCAAEDLSATCQNGTFVGVLSADNVITWLGVPYAKAPVDSLRWKAPEAPDASTETFNANKFSAMPLQQKSDTRPASLMPQDEDCLYLNVWKASDDTAAASRPVMVWIHGGSFRSNGTGEPEWLGHNIVADNHDVIVVSVGYRLGLMGFIDFSEVSGGEEFAESGNLGLLDVLQSLKWLKDNVAAFGGDPDNITVFGQSSGSALISLLMTMSDAQGLFKRAILQSGAVSMSMASADATGLAQKLLELTGKSDMAGLMALSSNDLQVAATKLDGALNFPERDGVVLSEDVYTAFTTNAGDYDILIGSDADEARYFLGAVRSLDVFSIYLENAYNMIKAGASSVPTYGETMAAAMDNFIALQGEVEPVWAQTEFLNDLLFRGPAIQMASSHTGTGKTYMYYWNIPVHSAVSDYFGANIGACHGSELPYVFDIPGSLVPKVVLKRAKGQALSTLVQNMWVDFAKDGTIDNHTQYTSDTRTTIVISSDAMPISEQSDPLSQQRELITPLLALNISGRDIINAISNADSENNPEDGDKDGGEKDPTIDDPKTDPTVSDSIGSSDSGCNAGMFPLIFMLLVMPVAIRKKY